MGSHLALQPIARVCMDLGVHPFAKQHTGDAADVVTLQLAAVLTVLVAVKARELVKVKGV